MRGFWLFVHFLGFSVWIGAGLAAMLAGIVAKNFAPAQRLAVYRAISFFVRSLIGPGAILVVVSGFILSAPYFSNATVPTWLLAMQSLGFIGAVIAVAIVTPTAARLGRLDVDARGELPEAFVGLRRRQAIFATLSGVLALLSLATGTFLR